MILGRLDQWQRYGGDLSNSRNWQRAFVALRDLRKEHSLGIWPLHDDPNRMFLNYHSYETRARADCSWEGHRRYIDLQYVLAGSERIDWAPASEMVWVGGYDAVTDLQAYSLEERPTTQQCLRLDAGTFVIFFPEDAHRPQIADGEPQTLWKAVVKVECSLVDGDEMTDEGK